MNLGEKIKFLRNNLNLTQEELAVKAGLTKNAIWNYENGKRSPSTQTTDKLAIALKVPTYTLYFAHTSAAQIVIHKLNTTGLTLEQICQKTGIPLIDLQAMADNFAIYSYNSLIELIRYVQTIDKQFFESIIEEIILNSKVKVSKEDRYELLNSIHNTSISLKDILVYVDEEDKEFVSALYNTGYFNVENKQTDEKNNIDIFLNFLISEKFPTENLSSETIKSLYSKTIDLLEFEFYKIKKQ